jgi:NadR type nicotinamide-nucleotide adenylyltransferase
MTLRTVCLHGPESTGKSTMAPRLAHQFDSIYVAEFGRTYCETYGIDLNMSDLVVIAQTQDAKAQKAIASGARPVILDTDPLMSAVWADMLFGRRDPWFDRWTATADLYLLFDIDLPWIDDGTRMFGTTHDRRRFFDLSTRELERRGVPWVLIDGAGSRRYLNALAAIHAAMAAAGV